MLAKNIPKHRGLPPCGEMGCPFCLLIDIFVGTDVVLMRPERCKDDLETVSLLSESCQGEAGDREDGGRSEVTPGHSCLVPVTRDSGSAAPAHCSSQVLGDCLTRYFQISR